jgi:uncharacterized protein
VISFFDSSALAKLYLTEPDQASAQYAMSAASVRVVSRLAWVETLSAFARRVRMGASTKAEADAAIKTFSRLWQSFSVVEASAEVVTLAGNYVTSFGLRAYDSVQLASAVTLQGSMQQDIVFATFDKDLRAAASASGLMVIA